MQYIFYYKKLNISNNKKHLNKHRGNKLTNTPHNRVAPMEGRKYQLKTKEVALIENNLEYFCSLDETSCSKYREI